MKPEVRMLFGALSCVPREERERYYAAHSVPDEVRRDLESLLAYDRRGRVIDDIIQNAVGLVFQESVKDGDYCGPYQLVRLIGRGGMGLVYLAERTDGEVRQRVAVKLLRAALDSTIARHRFRQERQILANLSHPNIARLIDAGHRSDGHPYLVMEYIEGRPIDEYTAKSSAREKVALMATVCDAISYAHQKLVVHRDLKPRNILVDGEGNPRVLDFGIAKLIDASDSTVTIERHLTPEYASPEQCAGAPVTTATDIYSLGAVLYNLLTGQSPSRVGPLPDRDLDAIVQKAVRAEPQERYATADKLADDLRAWLDHRPVRARKGERWYYARRQLRRHWVLAAAGSTAAAGLIVGMIVAGAERDIAQRRFEEVRQLANQLFVIEQDIRSLPGATAVRERIVGTSIEYLEGLSKGAGADWRLKAEIAAGYRKAAEAQGVVRGMNLGRTAEAQQSLNKAAALLNEVSAAMPGNRAILHDLIELLELQSRIEYGSKNLVALDAKLTELQGLLVRYEATAKEEISEWQFLGKIYESMALSARDLGRMERPMGFARRSVALRNKVAEQDDSFAARGSLANALSAYAGMLRATGDLSAAVETFRQSLTVLEQMAAADPNHYTTQLNIANTHAAIGRNLGDATGPSLRQTEAALKHFEESIRRGRRLMAVDANDRQIRFNHSVAAWRLGDALRGRDPRRALAIYDEAIEILRPMPAKRFVRDAPLVASLAESTFALRALGRESESEARLLEANAIAEAYRGVTAPVYETCRELISRAEAALALARGRPLEAVAAHREWLRFTEGRTQEVNEDIHSAYLLARRYGLLRDAQLAAGLNAEAQETERKRRAVIDFWKGKLSGRNNAEVILSH